MTAPVAIVCDTSVFTNPSSSAMWGPSAELAVAAFVRQAHLVTERMAFYMPLSVFEELKTFLGDAVPAEFELVVHLQSPNRFNVLVPGFMLYALIDDMRARIDRGLRVAEKAVREAVPANLDKVISRLRDQYRSALRAGLLDSKEDVDLILLAHELGAALVSSDTGVVTWAERMGLRIIHPDKLQEIMAGLNAS